VPNPSVDVDSREGSACYPRRTFYPLSDGPSTRNRRITKTWFPTCSTCRSRSQAPLCLYTLRVIAKHAEGTFVRLRYNLGGDRPSQTAHLAMSRHLLQGARLETQQCRGGISRSAPRELALPFQSLPPILHIQTRRSLRSCSKGARGLSVLLRVLGILTETPISPSSWLRQCPSRYAIRAGRNLPDKEFRYLRTVIVTAAVYRGFISELQTEVLTPPFNLPAPGRRQCLYVVSAT
jgi:hypothetical protein